MDDVLYQVGRGGRNGEGLGFGRSWDRKRLLHALCSSLVNNFRIVNAAPLRAGAPPPGGARGGDRVSDFPVPPNRGLSGT